MGSKVDWEQAGVLFVGFLDFFLEVIGVLCDSGSEPEGMFFRFFVGLLETRLIGWPIERRESYDG